MRREATPATSPAGPVAWRDPPVPLAPRIWRVRARRVEADDVVTLDLEAPAGATAGRPGQFNMVTAFGVGEIPLSLSGTDEVGGAVRHTIRDVGAVSHALCATPRRAPVGVRGPYGTDWGLEGLRGDVVVVAGGIGLAPLRGAISALAERLGTGRDDAEGDGLRLFVAIGARRPEQLLFAPDVRRWRQRGATVSVTVDVAEPGWRDSVGVVTELLPGLGFDPSRASALVCGPEVMMRFVARALTDEGVAQERIRVSLERNMQCGVAVCGHCQLGPLLLCRDGPVVDYASVAALLAERER